MNYDYREISAALAAGPAGAVAAWEETRSQTLRDTAEKIILNREKSPVVLLSGPSGSGKTTTGLRLKETIISLGVTAHLISMDDYFVSWEHPEFPRTPEGARDLESPYCMDIPLLNEHFAMLEHGGRIAVPIYDFPTHSRVEGYREILDGSHGDVFIFEGIHALNPLFTGQHPHAFRLYVSPEKGIEKDGEVLFTPILLRLMRRVVRDAAFRGAAPEYSLELWSNVLESEKVNVTAYRDTAHVRLNTTLPYEAGVMKAYALKAFGGLGAGVPCWEMVEAVLHGLEKVETLPSEIVPEKSILREFIG